MKKILGSIILSVGLCFALAGCGDDNGGGGGSAEDACDQCPAELVEACEQAVESCVDNGGGDECAEAADEACDELEE